TGITRVEWSPASAPASIRPTGPETMPPAYDSPDAHTRPGPESPRAKVAPRERSRSSTASTPGPAQDPAHRNVSESASACHRIPTSQPYPSQMEARTGGTAPDTDAESARVFVTASWTVRRRFISAMER